MNYKYRIGWNASDGFYVPDAIQLDLVVREVIAKGHKMEDIAITVVEKTSQDLRADERCKE